MNKRDRKIFASANIDSAVLAEELSSLQKHLDSESDESIREELFRLIEKYK